MSSSDDATRKLRSGSRQPLLRVEALSVQFPVKRGLLRRTVGQFPALSGIEFRVLRGQTLVLVGEAGAGKTTLARAIACQVPVSAGKLLFEGKDLLALDKPELRAALTRIQLLTPQTCSGPDSLDALAALQPALLIFDEVFDALDAAARVPLLEQVRRLQDERGLSCVMLTRSLQLAQSLSDEALVMYAGQIIETGATAGLVRGPHHPHTQDLSSPGARANPALAGLSNDPLQGCRFRARCPRAFARCAETEPALFAVPGGLSRCFLHDPDGSGA